MEKNILLREKIIYECFATDSSYVGRVYITTHKNIIGKFYSKEKDEYRGFEIPVKELSSICKENENEIVLQCREKFYRFTVENAELFWGYIEGLIASLDFKMHPL